MKLHLNKTYIFFSLLSLLVFSCSYNLDKEEKTAKGGSNTNTFPHAWDKNYTLRKANHHILSWIHKIDSTRPFEYKKCLLLEIHTDSIGNKKYTLSLEYTNQKPFEKWYTSAIHYAPNSGEAFGFHELHIIGFNHRPSKFQIDSLMERWMIGAQGKEWNIVEYGVDTLLWVETLGFIPDNYFK